MAEQIKVNTQKLKNDTDTIAKDLKEVQKKITAMKSDVAALNKMWSGDANAAFNQTFNKDINLLLTLCNSLEEIISYERTAKTEYDKCETKIASMIEAMGI